MIGQDRTNGNIAERITGVEDFSGRVPVAYANPLLADDIGEYIHLDDLPAWGMENIIALEEGELDDVTTIGLIQSGVLCGMIWGFQGFYGRYAQRLLDAGLIFFI